MSRSNFVAVSKTTCDSWPSSSSFPHAFDCLDWLASWSSLWCCCYSSQFIAYGISLSSSCSCCSFFARRHFECNRSVSPVSFLLQVVFLVPSFRKKTERGRKEGKEEEALRRSFCLDFHPCRFVAIVYRDVRCAACFAFSYTVWHGYLPAAWLGNFLCWTIWNVLLHCFPVVFDSRMDHTLTL